MDESPSTLIAVVQASTASLLTRLRSDFPEMKETFDKGTPEQWDFFLTAAATGFAFSLPSVPEADKDRAKAILVALDKKFPSAYENFLTYLNAATNPQSDMGLVIGSWVVWNVKNDKPNEDELNKVAVIIGSYLIKIVVTWKTQQFGYDESQPVETPSQPAQPLTNPASPGTM